MTEEIQAALEERVSPVPEAPASATVRFQLEGFEYLFTVREFDGKTPGLTLLGKLKAINEKIVKMGGGVIYGKNAGAKAVEGAPTTEGEPTEKLCPVHNVMMTRRTGTSGTWYSHTLGKGPDGKSLYCNGQPKS